MKRSLLFLLTAMLSVATWAYDFDYGGFFFNIIEGTNTVEVTWGGEKNTTATDEYTGDMVIPSRVQYGQVYDVVGIGDHAFYKSTLTSIVIPEGVTYLDQYAFEQSSSLESVSLPEGLESMGLRAFRQCTSLTGIDIPSTVTSLEESCFYGCNAIVTFDFPSWIDTVPVSFLSGCKGLEQVTLHEGLVAISNNAFYECALLNGVEIPSTVTVIEASAFYGNSSLTSITLPEGVDSLGAMAFRGCSALETLTMMCPTVVKIGNTNILSSGASTIIYVPAGIVDGYLADEYWGQFDVRAIESEEEVLLYTTDFTEWAELDGKTADGVDVTVATTTGGDLTFTLWGVSVVPGENLSESSSGTTNFKEDGALKFEKYGSSDYPTCPAYFVTSTLGSVSRITFTEGVTGSDRGAKVSVKGDGDEDWVVLYEETMKAGTRDVELDVNRTNCQLMFENLAPAQYVYIFELNIWGTDAEATGIELTLDPADGETVQSLGTITISAGGILMEANWDDFEESDILVFDKTKNLVASGKDFDYEEDENGVKTSYTIILDNTIVEEGYYTYQIPAGFFYIGGLDNMSEELNATVYVDGSLAPEVEYSDWTFDPADGDTVDSLSEIVVAYAEGIDCSWNYMGQVTVTGKDEYGNDVVVAYDVDAETEYPEDDPWGDGLYVTVYLNEEVTADGVYTITFPAGYFIYGPRYFDSEEMSITVTVGTATGINGVTTEGFGDDRVYNLNGQRVSAPTHGVYIINGQKVLVK